jgi:hypothetical protein
MTDLEREIAKEKRKIYYENNKQKILEWNRKSKNKKSKYQIKEYRKKTYLKNKLKSNIESKIWRLNNLEKAKEYQKIYRQNNKEKAKNNNKIWRLNNKQLKKEKAKEYNKKNKDKINKYIKNKKQTNPLFKLRCNIATLIRMSIKKQGYNKQSKTCEILGCSYEDFKQHLERQFLKGMSWDNRSEWHLDHIYPVSLAKDEAEIIKLNHYTNFQPMWAAENLIKGNKIIPNTQIKLI